MFLLSFGTCTRAIIALFVFPVSFGAHRMNLVESQERRCHPTDRQDWTHLVFLVLLVCLGSLETEKPPWLSPVVLKNLINTSIHEEPGVDFLVFFSVCTNFCLLWPSIVGPQEEGTWDADNRNWKRRETTIWWFGNEEKREISSKVSWNLPSRMWAWFSCV